MELRSLLERIEQCNVLVIGDIVLDHYIMGSVHRISPEAPVPVLLVNNETDCLGASANVALNVRALGAACDLIGSLGNDMNGQRCQALLSQKSIGQSGIQITDTAPTIIKTRLIAGHQQMCRIDKEAKPKNYVLSTETLLEHLRQHIEKYDALIISDYAKGVVSNDWIQTTIELARKHGKLIAADPKPVRAINWKYVSLLTPNKAESFQLAGLEPAAYDEYPAELICKNIWERYQPEHLAITLSNEGMLLSQQGRIQKQIPTYAQEVYDVSGAGDTVIASLTLGLAAGASLEEAAHLANTAAGIVVSKLGTATATPEEIVKFHAAHA